MSPDPVRRRGRIPKEEHPALRPPKERTGIVPIPKDGNWKALIRKYLKKHPAPQRFDKEKGSAVPRLHCTSNFGPELQAIPAGQTGWVTVKVWNAGNGVSHNAFVQVYEGPYGYSSPVSSYRLSDYKIIVLNPGQSVDVKLRFTRRMENARIVATCFDPFLDPRDYAVMEQFNPHITSIHY